MTPLKEFLRQSLVMNNQPSATKSILYAIATILAIVEALFVGAVTASDSIVPGTVVGLLLMIMVFAVGYAIGHFIVQAWNRRRSASKHSDLLPVGIGVLALGFSMCGLVYGAFAYWIYEATPFPSPAPYPGSKVEQTWHNFRESASYSSDIFEYTVEQSLNEMEQYYTNEMLRYCAPGWKFKDTDLLCDIDGYSACRTTECEIVRPWAKEAQFFTVYLRAISSSQTNIIYFETTKNFK